MNTNRTQSFIEIFDINVPSGVLRSESLTISNPDRDARTIAWLIEKYDLAVYGARVVDYDATGLPISATLI